MSSDAPARSVRRRGGAGGSASQKGGLVQAPRGVPHNPWPQFQIVSAEQVEAIHSASLDVLATIGMEILHEPSRALLAAEGCRIEGEKVFLDPAMVEEKVALAPAEVTLHARNPANSVTLKQGNIVTCAVGGPAFATDLDRGRRNANFADMENFTRIVQCLDVIHIEGGGAIEPTDLPA